MICLSTLTLAGLMAALFIAQLIRGDGRRAQMTFFMGIMATALQHLGCVFGGNLGGWLAFAAIILLIVLVGLVHGGVFDSAPSIIPDNCVPIPSGGGGGGGGGGSRWPQCAPACPLCPGEDPCPIPDYLPY